MKKNLLVVALSVAALSTLPGCGDKKVVTEETTKTTVESTPLTTEEVTVEEVREAAPVEEEAK
jgi:hypothetical protein